MMDISNDREEPVVRQQAAPKGEWSPDPPTEVGKYRMRSVKTPESEWPYLFDSINAGEVPPCFDHGFYEWYSEKIQEPPV